MNEDRNRQSNMSRHTEFYEALPRFTEAAPKRANAEVAAVIKSFEWENRNYRLRINPAEIVGAEGYSHAYLPGAAEREIEAVLRALAGMLDAGHSICFLGSKLEIVLGNRFGAERIELALTVLAASSYKLMMGESSYGFSIISSLEQTPYNDDMVYLVHLSSMASPKSELFQDPEFVSLFWNEKT
jgi:hypothetical protein